MSFIKWIILHTEGQTVVVALFYTTLICVNLSQ